ncbi:MAG: glycosyltransferase, partial [Proteobacteria bacterium]|nr:glycosyltransferase [Pseudomonadota bacterium]
MTKTNLPTISIIIPVKPGGYVKALEAVRELAYPAEKLEIFVAEGRQPSRQRNEAVNLAKGDILYFLDDDSCPEPGNLQRIAVNFLNSNVEVVGGPSVGPEKDSFIQQCFAQLFMSPFGGAGIRNRYQRRGKVRETSEKELILCNLSFRAEIYKKMGGLNESLYPNEENELMARIKEGGGKLLYDPDLFVYRSHRKNIKTFIKQILSYGRGRMKQTMLRPASFDLTHFIPLFFLFYCISLIFIYNPLYRLPLVVYVCLDLFFSLSPFTTGRMSMLKKVKMFSLLSLLFPVMHLSY